MKFINIIASTVLALAITVGPATARDRHNNYYDYPRHGIPYDHDRYYDRRHDRRGHRDRDILGALIIGGLVGGLIYDHNHNHRKPQPYNYRYRCYYVDRVDSQGYWYRQQICR